jgi:hypothetical protein
MKPIWIILISVGSTILLEYLIVLAVVWNGAHASWQGM